MAYWTTRDWDIILSTDERRFAEIFFMIEAERAEVLSHFDCDGVANEVARTIESAIDYEYTDGWDSVY